MNKKAKWMIVVAVGVIFMFALWRDMLITPSEKVPAVEKEIQVNDQPKWETADMKAEVAPDVTFKTLDGKDLKLSDLKGKVVVINFWASWCPPCLSEFPRIMNMLDRTNGNVVAVLVSNDGTKETLEKFIETYQEIPARIFTHKSAVMVWDDEHKITQDVFQTLKYPESIILDSEGRMVRKIVGGDYPWDAEEGMEYIKSLIPASAQ